MSIRGGGMVLICLEGPWVSQGCVDLLSGRSELMGLSQAHSSPLLPGGPRPPMLWPYGWVATPSWNQLGAWPTWSVTLLLPRGSQPGL